MKANASKHKAMSYKYARKLEKKLKLEVEKLMRLADSADESEIQDGMDLPEELKIRETRMAWIAEAKSGEWTLVCLACNLKRMRIMSQNI